MKAAPRARGQKRQRPESGAPAEDEFLSRDCLLTEIENLRAGQIEIEHSQHLYAELFDSVPIAYVNLSAGGMIENVNLAAVALLGRGAGFLRRNPFLAFVEAADRPRFLAHLARCRETAGEVATEVRLRGQATPRIVELVSRAIPSFGTTTVLYRTVIHDITARRAAETALARSEERFRALVENCADGICVIDPAAVIHYIGPAVHEMLGYEPSDAAGKSALAFVHPEDLAEVRTAVLNLLVAPPGKSLRAQVHRVRHQDGSWRWIEYSLTNLMTMPAVRGIVCNFRDITDRKAIEEKSARLLAQLTDERASLVLQYTLIRVLTDSATLAEAAPGILQTICDALGWKVGVFWRLEPDRKRMCAVAFRQQANVNAEGFMQKCLEMAIGEGETFPGRVWEAAKPAWVDDLVRREASPRATAAAQEGLRAGFALPIVNGMSVVGVMEFFQNQVLKPQPQLLERLAAVGNQIGQFIERTNSRDALRRSEQALRQMNAELELRVEERTAALRTANSELSTEIAERNRLEKELLLVSEQERRSLGQDLHDGLCQELTALAFMTSALGKRVPEAREELGRLARQINHTAATARDVARGLHPVELDTEGLASALHELAKRTAEKVPCTLECGETQVKDGDVRLNLYRIAQEAVTNAVKHAGATQIGIRLSRDEGMAMVSVSDNGRGMRTKTGQRGLGLHLMRYRARTLGGSISIRNLQPRGTELTCSLPDC